MNDEHEIEPASGELSDYEHNLRQFMRLYGTLGEDVTRAFRDADLAAKNHQDADDADKREHLEDTRRARRNAARALYGWIKAIVRDNLDWAVCYAAHARLCSRAPLRTPLGSAAR